MAIPEPAESAALADLRYVSDEEPGITRRRRGRGYSYHTPDGALNPCIQCDEDESGPVFKAVAGRTRRNSGLASALCRPCESVASVTHQYGL